jgi:ParB/RepB/Spo0J family partition protein
MENIKVELQVVDIQTLVPNNFNPKKDFKSDPGNDLCYQKVKQSVEVFGLNRPILVRLIDENKYEIIDGFHRWTACVELGYKKIIINTLGKIDDLTAKEILLNFERAIIPVDPIKEAELLSQIVKDIPIEEISKVLPYTVEVIKNKLELVKFDWSSIDKKNQDKLERELNKKTVSLALDIESNNLLAKALKVPNMKKKEDRFTALCQAFIESNIK